MMLCLAIAPCRAMHTPSVPPNQRGAWIGIFVVGGVCLAASAALGVGALLHGDGGMQTVYGMSAGLTGIVGSITSISGLLFYRDERRQGKGSDVMLRYVPGPLSLARGGHSLPRTPEGSPGESKKSTELNGIV